MVTLIIPYAVTHLSYCIDLEPLYWYIFCS